MIQTRHIREMLSQAIDACERAEALGKRSEVSVLGPVGHGLGEEIQRLLEGAAINASHAASELNDERFRAFYGEDGYTR